jgi:exopolysaccharide biosynthesis polyprenyl glycosylphosphotransferase
MFAQLSLVYSHLSRCPDLYGISARQKSPSSGRLSTCGILRSVKIDMSSSPQRSELSRSLDLGCILLAFAAASAIATLLSTMGLFTWPDIRLHALKGWPPDYLFLLVSTLVLWAIVSAYANVYRQDRVESANQANWRLARALLLWLGATGVAIFFLKLQTVSRQFDLSFFSLASGLIMARQFVERDLLVRRIRSWSKARSAIIVGPPREAEWLLDVLSSRREWYGSTTLADLKKVQSALNGNSYNGMEYTNSDLAEVFLLPGAADQKILEEWALRLVKQGRIVHVVPALIDAQLFRRNLGDIAGVPTITLETENPHGLEGLAKRILDIAGSVTLLVLLCPLMGLIALLVRLTSPGPAIFVQERLGKRGKRFKICKFRTMREDAEQLLLTKAHLYRQYQENNFKLPDGQDHRITKIGRWLRASSLDELPQLVNVLRGDMSLVGPRPIVPAEIDNYGEYGSLLLSIKPGMTGNWQVNGRSRITQYSERVKLDMEYLRDQSTSADLRILIRTVGAVARMDGAY